MVVADHEHHGHGEEAAAEEQRLREQLALCIRVAHKEGLNEGCDNHFTVALEEDAANGGSGNGRMLTLPYGILWSDCKPEDFYVVDFDGNILVDTARNADPKQREEALKNGHTYHPLQSAIQIHGGIHKTLGVRAKVVFHTHPLHSTALAGSRKHEGGDELKMVHQNCARFFGACVNYRDFGGIVDNKEEGQNIAKCFLQNDKARVMLMRLHGITVISDNC